MGCWSEIWEAGDEQYAAGKCPDCDTEIDGEGNALRGCSYSPISCETCGYKGCDNSC